MLPPNLSAQHLAQLQTSDLPSNDEQLAAYHTTVHYSPTPDNPDRAPCLPALFEQPTATPRPHSVV